MTQELIDKFVLSARGTFLEEDRNSNFPNENTLLMTDKTAWEEFRKALEQLDD